MITKNIKDEKMQLFHTWKRIKQKYPDTVVVVRSKEVYLTFSDDAIMVSGITSVKLTKGKDGRLRCSFPFYRLDDMLSKLTKADYKIAVCDQLEMPIDKL